MISENIKIIDHRTAVKKWISATKLVFFCGAGVSIFSPTNLPSGENLLETCYKSLEKQFYLKGFPNIKLADLCLLPLETLLGMITEDLDDSAYLKKLTKITYYFQNVLPNRLHLLIAEFISCRKRCHIITTNYDLGFEKAIEKINNPSHSIKIYGNETLNSIDLKGKNCLFKIHGCSRLDKPQNITLTTKQEASGFPKKFLEALKEIFENSLVVFLGYSLSEPDCLEALMNISNFDTIWVIKDFDSLEKNTRAQSILKQSRKAFVLKNLIPFIRTPINELNPNFTKLCSINKNLIDSLALRNPFSSDRDKEVNNAINLFKNLIPVSNAEKLFRIIISAYLQLRDFDKVDKYLVEYKKIHNYSKYFYLFAMASIIRDKNREWKNARDYFMKAANIESISFLDRVAAQIEQYGLESLIAHNNFNELNKVRKKLLSLISLVRNQLNYSSNPRRIDFQRILARLQKNIVQNLIYQKVVDEPLLKRALQFSEKGIKNSLISQEIQTRVEIERFKARTHYKFYFLLKDKAELNKALIFTEKALNLFLLLGVNMGIINARRQYGLILITLKRYEDAEIEIKELKNLLIHSPDKLSQIKLIALEIYLSFRKKRPFKLVKNIFCFFIKSKDFTGYKSYFKNIILAIKWYFYWLRGIAG